MAAGAPGSKAIHARWEGSPREGCVSSGRGDCRWEKGSPSRGSRREREEEKGRRGAGKLGFEGSLGDKWANWAGS